MTTVDRQFWIRRNIRDFDVEFFHVLRWQRNVGDGIDVEVSQHIAAKRLS